MLKKKQRGKTVIHQARLHKKNENAITPRSSHCACERLTVAFKWNEQNQLLLYLRARISCWQCQICSAEMTDEDVWKELHIYRTRWKLNWCYKLNSVFNNILVFCYCISFWYHWQWQPMQGFRNLYIFLFSLLILFSCSLLNEGNFLDEFHSAENA